MAKKKAKEQEGRNWPLTVISIIMIIFDVAILAIVWNQRFAFEWWGLLIAFGAVSSLFLSYKAIKTNNPAWLLLDIILPN